MEWIDFRITKPEADIVALVTNVDGWMYYEKARYDKRTNCWIFKTDYNSLGVLCLDVTHYLEIPPSPGI